MASGHLNPFPGGTSPVCICLLCIFLSSGTRGSRGRWPECVSGRGLPPSYICQRVSVSPVRPRTEARKALGGSVSMQLLGLHLNTSLSPQERKNTSPIPSPRRVGQMIEWVCLCMFGGLAMHACRCCEGLSSVCTPLLSSLYSLLPSWAKSGFTAPSSNSSLTVWGSWVGILH